MSKSDGKKKFRLFIVGAGGGAHCYSSPGELRGQPAGVGSFPNT